MTAAAVQPVLVSYLAQVVCAAARLEPSLVERGGQRLWINRCPYCGAVSVSGVEVGSDSRASVGLALDLPVAHRQHCVVDLAGQVLAKFPEVRGWATRTPHIGV